MFCFVDLLTSTSVVFGLCALWFTFSTYLILNQILDDSRLRVHRRDKIAAGFQHDEKNNNVSITAFKSIAINTLILTTLIRILKKYWAQPSELLELGFIGGAEVLKLMKRAGRRHLWQSMQGRNTRGQTMDHRQELLDKRINLLQWAPKSTSQWNWKKMMAYDHFDSVVQKATICNLSLWTFFFN